MVKPPGGTRDNDRRRVVEWDGHGHSSLSCSSGARLCKSKIPGGRDGCCFGGNSGSWHRYLDSPRNYGSAKLGVADRENSTGPGRLRVTACSEFRRFDLCGKRYSRCGKSCGVGEEEPDRKRDSKPQFSVQWDESQRDYLPGWKSDWRRGKGGFWRSLDVDREKFGRSD